jgi:S1-C subfamily serine protease
MAVRRGAIAVAAVLAVHGAPLGARADEASNVPRSAAELKLSFAPIVKVAASAVVNIYARKLVRRRQSLLLNDPFFRRFLARVSLLARPRTGSRICLARALSWG